MPLYVFLFAGTMGTFEGEIVIEVILFLFIPFLLATLTRYFFQKKKKVLQDKIISFFDSAQMIFLCLAIAAMFASQGAYLLNNVHIILLLLLPLFYYQFYLSGNSRQSIQI